MFWTNFIHPLKWGVNPIFKDLDPKSEKRYRIIRCHFKIPLKTFVYPDKIHLGYTRPCGMDCCDSKEGTFSVSYLNAFAERWRGTLPPFFYLLNQPLLTIVGITLEAFPVTLVCYAEPRCELRSVTTVKNLQVQF